jgi:hypothetical protein
MAQRPNTNTEAAELLNTASQAHAVAPTQNNAPALKLGELNIEEDAMEVASSGGIPVLKFAFGVGALAEAGHPQGTVVLGDYVLGKKGDTLSFFVLGANRYYKENTDFIPGQRIEAQRLPTAAAVHALGKTTDWTDGPNGKRVQPDFSPAADLIILLRRPTGGVAPYFTMHIDGADYAMARVYTDKNVYRFFGDPVIKSILAAPKPYALEFSFSTQPRKLGMQNTTMPVATLVGKTPEKIYEALLAHLGA